MRASSRAWLGTRVAALVKVGGWASHVVRRRGRPGARCLTGSARRRRRPLVVNGITAWQMLHRKARVRAGQTIVVHGANGGVGSVLVQLARPRASR